MGDRCEDVMSDNSRQDEHIDEEEKKTGYPEREKCVESLKL